MKTKITKLLFGAALALSSNLHGQPLISEDRMYLKVSPAVIRLEQDIYQPNFPEKEPTLHPMGI